MSAEARSRLLTAVSMVLAQVAQDRTFSDPAALTSLAEMLRNVADLVQPAGPAYGPSFARPEGPQGRGAGRRNG